ncbi:MAG: Yip1 family protein [Promethearchaeota archaeon]
MTKLRCPECLILVDPGEAVCPQCRYRFRTEQFERILPFMKRPEKQWESRLTFRQRLWGILRFPAVAFWDIAHELDSGGPALLFLANLAVIALWFIAMAYHVTDAGAFLFYGFFGVFAILALLYMLLNLFYFGIIQMIINYSGREGQLSETFLMGQYALLPFLFANLISAGLLFVFLPPVTFVELTFLYIHPIWLAVYALASIAMLWGAVLLSLGIRERFRMSSGTALVITMSVTLFVVIVAILVRLTVIPII